MLIGNVGKDPEVRYLDGNAQGGQGRKVATFTLATTERFRDRNGESRENTEWHNITAWGQPADTVEKFVKKGTQLYIEGRLRTRSWTDQSGNKRYTTEINVDNLQRLGRRDASDNGTYPGNQGNTSQGDGYRPNPYTAAGPQQSGGYQQNSYTASSGPQQQYPRPSQPAPQPVQQTPAVDDNPADDLPF